MKTMRPSLYNFIATIGFLGGAAIIVFYGGNEWEKWAKGKKDKTKMLLISDALSCAKAIERDAKNGIAPLTILDRYRLPIEVLIPKLMGAGNTPELNALSRTYENLNIDSSTWTNLATHIQAAANSLK